MVQRFCLVSLTISNIIERHHHIHHVGCLITLSDCNGPILVLVSTDCDYTGCLITLSNHNRPILDLVYPILTIFLTQFQPNLADLITKSDKAVRAVHSCKCWFNFRNYFLLGKHLVLQIFTTESPKGFVGWNRFCPT